MRNITKVLLILIAVLVASISMVTAAPNGATVTDETNLGQLPADAVGNVDVAAGNITRAVLSTNASTMRWAGLFGNVSGEITLADTTRAKMYTWSGSGNLVYACSATPTWSAVVDADQAQVEGVYTFLGGSVNDDYSATFTGGSESIGSDIFTILSDYSTTDSLGATVWKTYSLWDTTNVVMASKVVNDGTAYNGEIVDFQMIMPEDGTVLDVAATQWNLWMELI